MKQFRQQKFSLGWVLALLVVVQSVDAQAQGSLDRTQILKMQSQAEADLAALLERIQSADLTEVESQNLITAQVQQLADAQIVLKEKTAALAKAQAGLANPNLSKKLEQEIEKVASLQAELEASRIKIEAQRAQHTASLNDVFNQKNALEALVAEETRKRLETAKLLNQKLIEIAELTKNQSVDKSEKIQSLLSTVSKLRTSLKDSREESNTLRNELSRAAKQQQNSVETAKLLNSQIGKLHQKLKEAEQHISSLKAELAKAVKTQSWLAERLKVQRSGVGTLASEVVMALESDVLFRSGSTRLRKAGKKKVRGLIPELEKALSKMPEGSDWVLVVEGHADATPIRRSRYKTNLALSIARALTVVRELTLHSDIDPKRLMAAGFGEFRPLQPGFTPEALAANRRVEFRITER